MWFLIRLYFVIQLALPIRRVRTVLPPLRSKSSTAPTFPTPTNPLRAGRLLEHRSSKGARQRLIGKLFPGYSRGVMRLVPPQPPLSDHGAFLSITTKKRLLSPPPGKPLRVLVGGVAAIPLLPCQTAQVDGAVARSVELTRS